MDIANQTNGTAINEDNFRQLIYFNCTQNGLAYINIHSTLNPGGEIRGQVLARAVPEPSTLGLLGAGLLGLAFARRKKAA